VARNAAGDGLVPATWHYKTNKREKDQFSVKITLISHVIEQN